MHWAAVLRLLALVTLANGAPVIAKKLLGPRCAWPLDFGLGFLDGRPLFGTAKTARGVVLAVAASAVGAPLLGLDWRIGAAVGTAAMAGDLAASFTKRRLGLPPSSRAMGLDQIPESLLPFLVCREVLGLTAADVVAGTAIFFVGEIALSRLAFRLRLREKPY